VLTELRIRNFAIIEEVDLEFSAGFGILTGETGAGKSILVDAVELLVGGRASVDPIRTGAEEAEISGVFSLPDDSSVLALLKDQDLVGSTDTELIVRRILSRSGRHRVYVNGRAAPLSILQSLGGLLIDIHGQHDQQSLFRPSVQLDLLDAFADLTESRARYLAAFEHMRDGEKRLEDLCRAGGDRQARQDLLRYQAEEIAAARIRPGEERELEHDRLLLSESRRLAELAQQIYGPLYEEDGAILGQLRALAAGFKEISAIDAELGTDRDRVDAAVSELMDVAHRLRAYRDRLEFDPERLDRIEERLDLLHRLTKKYGGSLEDVARFGETAATELSALESLEADVAGLTTEVAEARHRTRQLAETISRKRQKAAVELEKRLEKELKALHMERATVHISVIPSSAADKDLSPTGLDQVQFMFSANMGEPPQLLSRIASGGELSRVMLAMKSVLAGLDQVPVLIFDEVDAGIGGSVADVVGERLRQLSRHGHQVFCITHLAPIAVHAQHHFAVTKDIKGGRTVTKVTALHGANRIDEIARMLGGASITPKIRETARELLRAAQR
jgi:DNA repair protein RecN (Recombination protein N)